MCDARHHPLYRLFLTCASAVIYFVSFSIDSCNWVETDHIHWGLWKECNVSDPNIRHMLSPADQPGYYNAVRTFSCFALISAILFFFTWNDKGGTGMDLRPAKIYLSFAFFLMIVLAVLGGCYKDDSRWEDLDPNLGWCFYTALASGIIAILAACVAYKQHRIKTASSGGSKVAPKNTKPAKAQKKPAPKPQPPKKPGPPKDVKKPEEKKPEEKKPEEKKPAESKTQKKTSDAKPLAPPQGTGSSSRHCLLLKTLSPTFPSPRLLRPMLRCCPGWKNSLDQQQQRQSKVLSRESTAVSLNLDPCDIPELPGEGRPDAATPDYRLAVGEGAAGHETPKVAIPSSSAWNRPKKAMNFMKNYFKAAVGRRSEDEDGDGGS